MKVIKVIGCESVDKIAFVSRGTDKNYERLYGIEITETRGSKEGKLVLELTKAQVAELAASAFNCIS